MTPSLRLLLEDYLGLMREEGELDVYLPLLLSAMGHEIVFRAQKGPRQYGVDISSVGKDTDGKRKLFLWLVKCGDIGRRDWDSGEQSIRQSINDVGDTYLRTHVLSQHRKLPKKLVVLTNGDFNAALSLTIASYLTKWSGTCGVEASIANGSTLAAWTERYLLDEHTLPTTSRSLLRRMLANAGSPDLSISVGRNLVQGLAQSAKNPAKSAAARRKRQLSALRGIRTAISVLQVWAKNERNQLAAYRLAEFAVLCVWSEFHEEFKQGEQYAANEFAQLLHQLSEIAADYHQLLQPYCLTHNALAACLPDSLLVADAAFTELGRLGLQGTVWAFFAVQGAPSPADDLANIYANRVVALLATHSCTQSPAYDHHSIDIHSALLLLLACNRRVEAMGWIHGLTGRLAQAAKVPKNWPLTATFEEALQVRHGYEDVSDDLMSASTLLPILLVWSAALEMVDAYSFIREKILPLVPQTTLNFWSSDVGFDAVVASPMALHEHGVGEGCVHVPAAPDEFLATMAVALPGVEPIAQATWYQLQAPYIPLLAALHWRTQVPREMLVSQVLALTRPNGGAHGAEKAL